MARRRARENPLKTRDKALIAGGGALLLGFGIFLLTRSSSSTTTTNTPSTPNTPPPPQGQQGNPPNPPNPNTPVVQQTAPTLDKSTQVATQGGNFGNPDQFPNFF